MREVRKAAPPLDAEALERLALWHVQRFQTTRARFERYLDRKLRERGWAGDGAPPVDALGAKYVALGLIDDRAFAAARARAAEAKGQGRGRLRQRLAADGVADTDRDEAVETLEPAAQALAFARRRRLGPFGAEPVDRAARERQIATMARAGHPLALARRIVTAASETELEDLDTSGW
jgi:regulatory protein